MNINEFLEIADEFFSVIHPNYCDDYIEEDKEDKEDKEDNEDNKSEFWSICEDFFQQIGPQI
jgi:hypothetical protein